ncbi:MAG: hypothetical protein QN120_02855 [Armatimonadota bacterium]|nr:hypothetical protein [Armatimonadota bacterium]
MDIWPEHDDPRVLVIYRGQLSAGAPLPYTLAFAIPASGQVNAAAYRSGDGQLFSVDYQYRQDGDRLQVVMTTPDPGFQFEYYADLIQGRPQRTFVVDLTFPLAVDVLNVAVEQPLRASGFALEPPAASSSMTAAGLTHHVYTVGPWPAGRAWRLRARYQKADETPSLPRVVRTPAAPLGGPQSRRGLPLWAWAAVVAATLGTAGLVGFVARRRGGRLRTPGKDAGRPRDLQPVYCVGCGHRARPSDRYCSRCGRRIEGSGKGKSRKRRVEDK